MGLFGSNKLKRRIVSLEETLGYVYTREDGYSEHYLRTYGDVVRLKEQVKDLKEEN
jgi:hypothetical protein